jgi:hypothetical protein
VTVAGFGEVAAPPAREASRAAKAFVRARSRHSLGVLEERVRAAFESPSCEIVRSAKARLTIRLAGRDVARVDRYRILALTGEALATGDLLLGGEPWQGLMPRLQEVARKLEEQEARAAQRAQPAERPATAIPPRTAPRPVVAAPAPPPPASKPVAPAPRAPEADLRFDLPETLSAAAREAAMRASERLRTERRLVPAAAIEVVTERETVTFEPLREGENPLEARFVFKSGPARIAAALRLKRPSDPLTLHIYDASHESFVGRAWAAALVIYAELTCTELADALPDLLEPDPLRPSRRRPARPSGGNPQPRSLPRSRAASSRRHERAAAVTVAEAIERLQGVSGHLRRLTRGQTASDEARRCAEQAGIRLPPGYTWVRPHQRGRGNPIRVVWPLRLRLW